MRVCGKRIRELREGRGYSLHDLAERSGVSVSYLSEIERGAKRPSLKIIDKIAEALNTSKGQLVEAGSQQGVKPGERIRLLREKNGKNLSDLAEEIGISVSYLSEIERGNVYPAVDTLKKIANALGTSVKTIMDEGSSLGNRLRQTREERGLTQAQLAEAAGVSAGLIGQIEKGKVHPSLKTLEKIGKVLDISPCYFISEDVDIKQILNQLCPDLRKLLLDPKVQSVLRLICNCTEEELKFILNFIQLYKRSH
ncbi:MAG: hypothetical protein PWP31_1370 [Clostridia bacterium]|nr:hypothetical protein [Clostridia bacterium]